VDEGGQGCVQFQGVSAQFDCAQQKSLQLGVVSSQRLKWRQPKGPAEKRG
jgi:hypothetical protein